MILSILCIIITIWLLRSYCGWIVSSILSIIIRCPINVGDVRWFRLLDVRIRLKNGVTVHIDDWSIQFFAQSVSKPILLRFGDVRIEADSQVFLNKTDAESMDSTQSSSGRFTHLVQYCGVFINSIQLILLDAIPGCMLHMSGDELLAETFRSREGWQLELSSRLMHGKLYRRKESLEPLLANCALSIQTSIDVSGGTINRLGFRLADPSFNFNQGIIDVMVDFRDCHKQYSGNGKESSSMLARLQQLQDATISINNCTVVYSATNVEQRRSLSLRIGEVDIQKKNGCTLGKVAGLTLADHLHNAIITTGMLSAELNEISLTQMELTARSDYVVTTTLVHDIRWWKDHISEVTACLRPSSPVRLLAPSRKSQISTTFSIELDSIQCNISDSDSFHSTISVQLLTFSKKSSGLEFGAESLVMTDSSAKTNGAIFDKHSWGQTVYVGVALAQFVQDPFAPSLNICIDDLKLEWTDTLASQINRLLNNTQFLKSFQSDSHHTNQKKLTVKLKSKRAAVVAIAKNSSCVICMTNELHLEKVGSAELVCTISKTKIGHCNVTPKGVRLNDLVKAENKIPVIDREENLPYRCWSQKQKDADRAKQRMNFEENRNKKMLLVGEADLLCISLEANSPVTRDVTISSNGPVHLSWSPLLHRVLFHLTSRFKEALTIRKINQARVPPIIFQLKLLTNHPVELDLHLPKHHRILWKLPSLTFDKSANNLTAISSELIITMNGHDIVTAMNICITKRATDQKMELCRQAFGDLENATNKIWTWAADSFLFHLPFEFNVYEVFDEFINTFRWIKIVHGITKKPFTANSPLPADFRIVFKEARLEMDDDPFENLLQTSHDLKEDEIYECERRHQMLVERLNALKRANPLFPQTKMDELLQNLEEKNSSIYIERWKNLGFISRPIFVSSWQGFEIRAFADPSLHGTDICTQMIHQFDPLSYFPTSGLKFSTLWGRAVEFDMAEWKMQFRDYSTHYLDARDIHFFGNIVGAQHIEESGRSLRESVIELPEPWETHTIQRNMTSQKFYYKMQSEMDEVNITYGRCWEPCLSMISTLWNNINAKSRDPSPPLPYWDKMRFLLHGHFSCLCNKMVTTMLASPDPYNTTETLEFCWDNLGLDWALGEIRIQCGKLKVFIRTASRYDDSRIISLPDLKLRIILDWICGGDPHDHHAVVLCAPHKLPHYATNHDSYRAFRSHCLDLSLSFDVGAGSGNGENMPQCLFYANNFRCLEVLIKSFILKNRLIKKGPVFGTPFYAKPQISKHFRTVQMSVTLPKFFISYWMSHFSDYGFRITSDGLNLLVTMKLTTVPPTDHTITRRPVHAWSPEHVSATLWDTQVHVFGPGEKPESHEESQREKTLLLGISRVSYIRENNPGQETALHRLTAHDLKASWTADIRDACLTIADGVHRAHLLRRILSNDAIKRLNIHQEDLIKPPASTEPTTNRQESYWDERGHKRGYSLSDTNQSMLNLLIEESNTRLIAHCEQATDLPTENLQGVIQCTMDDVIALNWQVDLLNSQVVLKGSDRGGFVLLTAAHASLTQKIHKNAWRSGQLFSKKSWSSVVSGMQYFAPVGMSSVGVESKFNWLPKENIEEKPYDKGEDYLAHVVGDGEAVGGVVQPGILSQHQQLQRIVRRCSCEIYFCYYSEIMKTDTLEETVVQKVEPETIFGREEGIDCLTLKHNMLEASTSSEQYEMLVDIVNTLVLFVDPKKKEQAENRRRIQISCELAEMDAMRKSIEQQQAQLRQIVNVVRSLERQIFHMETSGQEDEVKQKEIAEEMEEYKNKQLDVADQLAIYISCYKQRQVEQTLAVVHKPEEDSLAMVARRFEVCFEDCIWRLTESDGQITLSEIQIRNFLYTRTMRIDNSGEHLFEVGSVRISNLLPETVYKDTLHRDDRVTTRQPALRLLLRDLAPVGGICVKEHFEVNIAPMVVQLTYEFFEKMMGFFFPGKNIDKEDQLENVEEGTPKISFTRRITGTLSMRSNKGIQMERKGSAFNAKLRPDEIDDIERMRQRAHDNNFFLYIKIPEVPFVVSYKGKEDKNIEDVDRFGFLFPLCEYHEKNWTWLDLSLAVKQRCRRILIQQFMKQKLLRNRILGTVESVEGMTEEEKKRITLGETQTAQNSERKKKK